MTGNTFRRLDKCSLQLDPHIVLRLDALKDGESGFTKWRQSFNLQVNAVWNAIDKVLVGIGGHALVDAIIDEDQYRGLLAMTDILAPAGLPD